jgi:hypothetical protein
MSTPEEDEQQQALKGIAAMLHNQARAAALRAKAEPMFALLKDQPAVKLAVDIALRKRERRLVYLVLAIDGRNGETAIPMQCSVTQKPIRKAKKA